MESRLFDADPITGSRTILHIDDKRVVAEERQDVGAIVEAAKRRFNSVDERASFGEMSHVSFIPMNILYELRRKTKGNREFDAALRKWLNDRDNRDFRTRPGRV
jgi:hypothetical protein